MSNANDPVAWIIIAEEDYDTARAALRRQSPWLHTACFHA